MAIKDTSKKTFIEDRDDNVFIGVDLPFRKSDGIEGWFASTTTTIEAVKNNIKNLLSTHKGERYMQPNIGLNLRKFLFEQFTDELRIQIENDILDTFDFWLPFVQVKNLEIKMSDATSGVNNNKLVINVLFNITRDSNTLESVQVEIGE
jgi:phage baseplate assembly protein W